MRLINGSSFVRFVVVALGIVFASACDGSNPVAPSLSISPSSAEVAPGGSVGFTATNGRDYSWSLTPTNCGSLEQAGDKATFRAGMNPMSCRVNVSSGSHEASASVKVTENPQPIPVVRASIEALEGIWQGSPDVRCDGCPPAVKLEPDAEGFYNIAVGVGCCTIKQGVFNPRKPGRSIKLTRKTTGENGFVYDGPYVREYPDESQIVGGIGWFGSGFGFPNEPGIYTGRLDLEEWSGDLPSPTLEFREYKFRLRRP